jgi:nitrate/nitrite transporter NarK
MIALWLVLASGGGLYQLYACNLVLLGLIGGAGMFSPTIAYVTRWFDRRRGSAVALVSSGQYVAGAVWPVLLEIGIDRYGWRRAMMLYGILIAVTVPVLASLFYCPPPDADSAFAAVSSTRSSPVAVVPPNLVLAILAAAIFCCCVTMSIPLAHMVAFCGEIGLGARAGAARWPWWCR